MTQGILSRFGFQSGKLKKEEKQKKNKQDWEKMRAANPTPNISEIVLQPNPRKYTKR